MSDILFAAILMSFFIGGSICAVGICVVAFHEYSYKCNNYDKGGKK